MDILMGFTTLTNKANFERATLVGVITEGSDRRGRNFTLHRSLLEKDGTKHDLPPVSAFDREDAESYFRRTQTRGFSVLWIDGGQTRSARGN